MYDPFPPSATSLIGLYGQPQQRDYSNNVLVSKDNGVYMLPAYLRIVFMEVEDVNIRQLTAVLYTTMMITIYYKNLPEELIQQLNIIEFSARNVETVTLRGQGDNKNAMVRNSIDTFTMEYVYRGKLPLRLESDVLLAPFQVIDFKLLLTFHARLVMKEKKVTIIKFNFMDIDDMETKCFILYKDSNVSGLYGLAESSLGVTYSPYRIPSIREERNNFLNRLDPNTLQAHRQLEGKRYKTYGGLIHEARVNNWRFVTFRFKMYRYPLNTILIVFVPLWILSFINLVIYFADPNDVAGRLQTISGLMIAYAALLPTIRDRIPPSPQITLLQYLIYALSFCIFLSTLDTLIAVNSVKNGGTYDFLWYRSWRFLLSMILTIATIVIMAFFFLLYKCVWEPRYNFTTPKRFGVEFQNYKIDTDAWSNPDATHYLREKTILAQPNPNKPNIKQIINREVSLPSTERVLPVGSLKQLDNPQSSAYNNNNMNGGNSTYQNSNLNRMTGPAASSNNQRGNSITNQQNVSQQKVSQQKISQQPATTNNQNSNRYPSSFSQNSSTPYDKLGGLKNSPS